jgi:ABC-type glycerol-3-phosphate transport system substrate-binding protein
MKKLLLVLLGVCVVAGCSSAVVTPEGTEASYSWVEGALGSVLAAPMPEVVNATTATLTDLELVAVDSTVDRLKGRITARMAVGTKVAINLEAVDFESTSIRIKVGTFGDRAVALQILRNIEKRLGK